MYYVYANFNFPWSGFKKVSASEELTEANILLHDFMNSMFPGVWAVYKNYTNTEEVIVHIDGYQDGNCIDEELKYSLGFVSIIERDFNEYA